MKILVNIDVPDLPAAIRFYSSALGLTHVRTLDDAVAELGGADATIYLLQKPAGSAAVDAPPVTRDYSRHWTPVHFDLVVDDVDAAVAQAIAAGAVRETGHIDWRGSRCVTLRDPFGHGFCLIEFREGAGYT